ncbi:hypothetical protein AB0G83_28930 [Streptomyces klenkii]|uniref:hypothetical protein n=1 Tax=Streptomyces klenkii TaxID=1420899 RepID=UPI0033D213D2
MKLSPRTTPMEPLDLLIRLHNLVGAAVDVTGSPCNESSRWACHGCGASSILKNYLVFTRSRANSHANECRAAYHHLG